MPSEKIRGCGYRKIHCLYLCGGGIGHVCDRLDIELVPCPTCGEVPRFNRGVSKIDLYSLLGDHGSDCKCPSECPLCHPKPVEDFNSFLMWVGDKYYTRESFILESKEQGVSKKISTLPKGMELGKSWVFLAKQGIIDTVIGGHPDQKKRKKADGIFYAFIPDKVDYLITQSESKNEEYVNYLKKQGLTVIVVPDDDPDHTGKKKADVIDDRQTLDLYTSADPHTGDPSVTTTASTTTDQEVPQKEISYFVELPQGITKWNDFIKQDTLKGLSMKEKAYLWREYKNKSESSAGYTVSTELFDNSLEEEEPKHPKQPLDEFL